MGAEIESYSPNLQQKVILPCYYIRFSVHIVATEAGALGKYLTDSKEY